MAPNANPEPFHFSLANLFKRELKIMNSRLKGRLKVQGWKIMSNSENEKIQIISLPFVLYIKLLHYCWTYVCGFLTFPARFVTQMPV